MGLFVEDLRRATRLVLGAGTWGATTVRYRAVLGVVVLVAYAALTFVTPAVVFAGVFVGASGAT